MDKITQEAYFRQRVIGYAEQHGVSAAANRYHLSRKTVYKWRKRYDGQIESLKDRSRRPHHSPRKQSEEELHLVQRLSRKYGSDLLLAYEKARGTGYTRSYGCFKRTVLRMEGTTKKRKKHRSKPYTPADYPGQKVQIDVKFVPLRCCADGWQRFVFVAKDECSRWTLREMYDEHSSDSARDFLEKLIRRAPFPIRLIQTDNGAEFTNALLVTKSKHKTLFEQALKDMDILYQRIRIATPRHNGKVERQHRIDELRFYSTLRLYNLTDGRAQLARYQRASNNHIMTCLGLRSPNDVLSDYLHLF